ncbi:MAG: hypothetical protein RBS43_06225 [Candidatus Cloacimonas sp.]|jgi:Ca2+/Na+ antiporter|nr:hypothetical protein [Candidatus Cloacimonas sp.]
MNEPKSKSTAIFIVFSLVPIILTIVLSVDGFVTKDFLIGIAFIFLTAYFVYVAFVTGVQHRATNKQVQYTIFGIFIILAIVKIILKYT